MLRKTTNFGLQYQYYPKRPAWFLHQEFIRLPFAWRWQFNRRFFEPILSVGLIVQNQQKALTFWRILVLKRIVFSTYRLEFFHQGLNQQVLTCRGLKFLKNCLFLFFGNRYFWHISIFRIKFFQFYQLHSSSEDVRKHTSLGKDLKNSSILSH